MGKEINITNFHRPRGIPSILSIGSIYTVFDNPTSGIHKAQSKCAQRFVLVFLKAPPSFGQNIHD